MRTLVLLATLLAFLAAPATAQNYIREELRLPMAAAGPKGLETLFVRPAEPGRYPLVVISHGTPRKPEDRARMTPWTYYPVAMEFARRGWAVAIVMRRGFGDSDGAYAERSGSCDRQPDYIRPSQAATQDIKATIAALAKRPDIDGTRVLAVGQSSGGLATVALTADPPKGLIGAISFAGGRGSNDKSIVCNNAPLTSAFRIFGAKSRVPMLWVYTANDSYFPLPLAATLHAAFTGAGGKAQLVQAPAYGKDGHGLFSLNGIPQWTPYVDAYLVEQKLAQRDTPMALPPLPNVNVPPQLGRTGREAFERYLRGGQHKAFAVNDERDFGFQIARRGVEEAKTEALKFCEGYKGRTCRIVFIDDAPAP